MSKGKQPLPARTGEGPKFAAVSVEVSYQHCTLFCPENEEKFKELVAEMDGWELVSVIPLQKHTVTANGAGFTRGWQTFWKRMVHKEGR